MSTTTSDGLLCLEDGREIETATLWKIRAAIVLLFIFNGAGALGDIDVVTKAIGLSAIALVLTLVYWGLLRLGSRKH